VDRLASLEESMVPVKKNSSNNSTSTQRLLESFQTESKLEAFLILAKNYFSTEADCVDFMRTRVVGLEIEAKELHREIAECSALGMATNVSKMSSSLDTFRRNILEDQNVVSALQREAETMRDELIERTEDFIKMSAVPTLSPSQYATLSTIDGYLSRIRIDASNPLFRNSSMANVAAEPPRQSQPQQPIRKPIKTRQQYQQQPPPPSAEPVVKTSMPKFSWGGRTTTQNKAGGKSLVDIQKEELTKQSGR